MLRVWRANHAQPRRLSEPAGAFRMTRNERILQDLKNNMREKMARNISDFSALCESADLDPRLICIEVMSQLIQLATAYAVVHFDIDTPDFLETVRRDFERTKRKQ